MSPAIKNDLDLISHFHTYLLTEKRVSKNTFYAYRKDIEQFILFLSENRINLNSCNKNHLKKYLKCLNDRDLSAKSLSRKISALKVLFKFLEERFDFENKAQGLIFPKLEKKLPIYLTEREIQKLFEIANKDESLKGQRNKIMLYLLYASGMRVSELVALTNDQIHFDTGFIFLTGKGSKERSVPLPINILNLLRYYLDNIYLKLLPEKLIENTEKKYLFFSVYSSVIKPISRQSFWIILKNILKKAKIYKNVSPHSLRHSLATHLLKNGADIRSLQILLGHENISTVQIYTHLEKKQVREIYDKKHPRA
ncbi:tyrosine recombinase [Candidatus Babeliales bacterium]|nr:tyrosine recombinase [Candidatus Babeliales bacterium]MCF7899124.1 tyrosine recombinase [Candidatus Babeliales bacterium]